MFKPGPEFETMENATNAGKKPPVVSVVGYSGSGKTTLVEKLIAEMVVRGIKVASIKHDAHGFAMDRPGKDSWRHKQAGACATIISSPTQIGMVRDADHDHTPDELAVYLDFADFIVAEGFKRGPQPKIEIFRPGAAENSAPVCLHDPSLIALVTDAPVRVDVPVFSLDDVSGIVDFILCRFGFSMSRQM